MHILFNPFYLELCKALCVEHFQPDSLRIFLGQRLVSKMFASMVNPRKSRDNRNSCFCMPLSTHLHVHTHIPTYLHTTIHGCTAQWQTGLQTKQAKQPDQTSDQTDHADIQNHSCCHSSDITDIRIIYNHYIHILYTIIILSYTVHAAEHSQLCLYHRQFPRSCTKPGPGKLGARSVGQQRCHSTVHRVDELSYGGDPQLCRCGSGSCS